MVRSFLTVTLLTVIAVGTIIAQNQEALSYVNEKDVSLSSAQSQVLAKAKQEKALASYQLIRFNNIASLKEQTSFIISLPGKASLSAERKRITTKNANEWTLSSTLSGNGSVFLSATNGDVNGVIQVEQNLYWLQPIGNGLHILIKVDPKKIPRDEPENWNPTSPDTNKTDQSKSENQVKSERNGLAKTTTTTPVIDILVAYTPAVASNSGNITSLVNACIQSTNESFANSNMNIQVALAQAVQVGYTESGYVGTDKDRLITSNDGYMDNIFALRDQYNADLVVLLVDFDSYGYTGIAAMIEAVSSFAYAVVVDNYAVGNYTFAHEIGHLVGGRHDDDPATQPRAYAHGYRYDPGNWRTIMAVYNAVVLRINYWSSPLNTYGGVAMGTASWNDNRRVWNERAPTVAGFRTTLIASISGPNSLAVGQQGTWTVAAIRGTGSYTYAWYFRSNDTGGLWYGPVSTSNSYTTQMYDFDKYLDLRADVTSGGEQISVTRRVTCIDCSGGPLTPQVPVDSLQGRIVSSDPAERVKIEQNYPNPFNPTTKISYSLPEASFVTLKVFDILGKEIVTLVYEAKPSGKYEVEFDASQLPSGTYVYRFTAGNFQTTRKMIVVK